MIPFRLRPILTLLLLVGILIGKLHAQHSGIRTPCGIGMGPSLDSLPRNAAILLETCGCDEPLLGEIGVQHPAWLVSESGDSVPMRRIEHHRMLQEQVLLGPGRFLKHGQSYKLVVPYLQAMDHLDWPDGLDWTIKNEICESRVGFLSSPLLDHKIKGELNGAILAVVGLAFAPLDSTEFYWVRITATDEWNGDQAQWLLSVAPGQKGIEVGYPMRLCGPVPVLAHENEYRIVATLIGVDGAEGRSSDPIIIRP